MTGLCDRDGNDILYTQAGLFLPNPFRPSSGQVRHHSLNHPLHCEYIPTKIKSLTITYLPHLPLLGLPLHM
jgi:hypothetical protein